jgi:hypothetical protein
MSTNIPYLAWRGENIRLVKCSEDLNSAELTALAGVLDDEDEPAIFAGADVSFFVEEWGGSGAEPSLIPTTRGFFLADGKICARASFESNRAGLARIKLIVNVNSLHLTGLSENLRLGLVQKMSLLQHQFLAGWMNLSAPTITELPYGGDGPNDQGNPLGSGVLNSFWADKIYADPRNEGVVQAKVTGTLPTGGDFAGMFPGDLLTLPRDWPLMASKLAVDANPDNENPSNRWDIHDQSDIGSFATEGHPYDALPYNPVAPTCATLDRPVNLAPGILDAVDNCDGGYVFSRVFDADGPGAIAPIWLGLTDHNTRGPFDPQRDTETFLPDGQLTADDAPMPAARIDFVISPKDHSDNTDISGVGSFGKTNKNDLYSADRPANANAGSGDDDPHNLYAPFYRAYVPATGSPAAEASGTDGLPGNNFAGYLVGDGKGGEGDPYDTDRLYDYWDIAHEFTGRTLNGYDTACLRREGSHPAFRQTPDGPQKVAIYTDEHGIGDVNFRPGSGFWFDALLATQPNLGGNLNGGCDLKYLKDNILGYSDITAQSHYPNQPVSDTPVGSATIRKTVKSLFAKYLAVYPKGSTPELRNARIVIAHAQDIDGEPFADEVVCFSNTSASGVIQAFLPGENSQAKKIGPYWLTGSTRVDDPIHSQSEKRVCVTTNQYGNAAIEVLESQGAEINVIADFVEERLLRDVHIPFGSPDLTPIDPGIPPRAPGAPGQPQQQQGPPVVTANGNTTPSAATLAALGNVQVSSSRTHRAARVTVRFARVVNSARGTRYLSLRLRGTRSTATVRIQLIGYNGKLVRTVRRTVAVGRTVRLRNVRLGANVRNVRVSVVNR